MAILSAVLGIGLLYLGWYIHMTTFSRIISLGTEHKYSYLFYFDAILVAALVALIISRAGWIIVNQGSAALAGFSLLPYERVGGNFEWLTSYPWRFLNFIEGVQWYIFWGVFGLVIIVSLVPTTMRLIRSLKVGKGVVKRNLIFKELWFVTMVIAYTALNIYLSF
jgi:hypothetical protein